MMVSEVENGSAMAGVPDNVGRPKGIAHVLYGGIRPEIPGHGGEECAGYLPPYMLIGETMLSTTIMVVVGVIGMRTFTMPKKFRPHVDYPFKRFLLVLLCITFGVEIGFKLGHCSILFLLNPCHIITALQIFLLASKPGKVSFSVLRILIHYLYGPLIAMLFPDTVSLVFPGEKMVFWIQHFLIFFIIPPYLVHIWGPNSLEPFKEWSWSCFSGILFGVHHHYIMQPVALISHVNLNYILCPATADPFNGPYYRLCAVFHQSVCLLTLGKAYTLLLKMVLQLLTPILPRIEAKKGE